MGAFTFGVSAALVVFQCTLLLLQLKQSTWSFSLVFARPNAAEWGPELSALLLETATHTNNNNRTAALPGAIANMTTNNKNNRSAVTTAFESGNQTIQLTVQHTGALTCLRAALNASHRAPTSAASCILRTHTPSEVTPVLAPFNAHLLLLSLACLQCLMTFGRMYRRQREGDEKRWADAPPYYISIEGVGLVLTAITVAATVVQGVHDADLVQYPTLITLVLNWLLGVWYTRTPEGACFHSGLVAAPLSVLCSMLFGPRLWPDVLQHYVLLLAAIQMALWILPRRSDEPEPNDADARPLIRAVALVLLLLPLCDAVWNTGPFDAWRYILILIGSVGLLPLFLSLLMPEMSLEVKAHHTLAGLELMANNAALLGVLVLLANL
jgi:hypothetical protein